MSSTTQSNIIRLLESLKGQLSQANKTFSQWLSASSAANSIVRETKAAISELKEANTLLMEISRADRSLSKSDLEGIGNRAFDVAGKYGRKPTDYLAGVQEATLAGYGNAADVAELSIAIQEAGGITAELANQYISAANEAYQLGGSAGRLKEILDGSNYITDRNAVSMAELATGMSLAASQAASLGMGADETVAALSTMIAVTQQGGVKVSEAFQTILLYLRQTSDLEKGINAKGLAKFEGACNALNVSLKETKNGVAALRSPMEVIRDLAEEYNKLGSSDPHKSGLLGSLGGGMPTDAFQAILENYSMYSSMLGQYKDGAGSMVSEVAKATDTWEGALNRLHNTWVNTIGNIADSDAIIKIINAFNDLASISGKITNFLGPAGSVGLIAGVAAGIKNVGMAESY